MDEHQINKWSKNKYAVIVIVLLGLFIYLLSFFNGFFADDFHQVVDNPTVHSLSNIPSYFTGSTFYTGASELTGNYYKPLLTTTYSLLYAVFGTSPTGY